MRYCSKRRALVALATVFPITLLGACDRLSGSQPANNIYEMAVAANSRSSDDRKIDLRRKPVDILRLAGVEPGMTIVDLLGGNGYYAELFNGLVGPRGVVYLQNNSLFLRFSTEGLVKRLENNRLKNVIRLDSEFANLNLPHDVDLIFMGLSYHDIYVPRDDPTIMTSREEFFPQIWNALKPGGILFVIDHAALPGSGSSSAPKLHRITENFTIKDITSLGFELIGKSDILRNSEDDYTRDIWDDAVYHKTDRFILLFRKPKYEPVETNDRI